MTDIPAPAHVRAIAPYQAGKPIEELAREYGLDPAGIIKLASNENPLGCSDRVRAALAEAAGALHGRYPDPNGFELKAALAARHQVPANWLTLGNGSNDLLELASLALLDEGTSAVYAQHAFVVYRLSTQARGARHLMVPARDYGHDLDAMLAAIAGDTRLVFIANPNNPTGTMISAAEIARLAENLPPQALLVLDGAYAEYVEGYDGGAALVDARDNVVMTRTFSKIYGLGGLRIGWGYGPRHVIDVLNRIRGPFNLSTTQLETAEAAVRDQEFVAKCRAENARMRNWLAGALAELGVPSDTSMANFVLARFASTEEAEACDAFLQAQGLIVRRVAGYKLPHCLRITIGDEASCRQVAHAVGQFKGVR